MRTEELWQTRIRQKVIDRKFTPRIRRDIGIIPPPEGLPETITEGVYLYSDTGFGKTIYAAFLLLQEERYMYLNNISGETIMVSVPELFQTIKNTYDNKYLHEADVLRKYCNVRLLVLDDFGVMKPTDWVAEIMYMIVNYRWENLLPTIYTSNKSLKEMAIFLGDDRIVSRIERAGKVVKKKHYSKNENT